MHEERHGRKNDFHSVIAVAGAALGMQIFVTTARAEPRQPQWATLAAWLATMSAGSAGRVSLDSLPITQSKRHLAWQFCVAFVRKIEIETSEFLL